MTDLKIDAEFQSLIPPLDEKEFNQLEENILRDGIRDPLVTWQGVIVDGHNRYQLALKHGLEFTTVEKEFADRDAVKIWIIKNQLGRRNLSAYDRSILALKLKPVIAAKAKENSLANLKQNTDVKNSCPRTDETQPPQETPKPAREQKTNFQVAQAAGVSEDTIRKVEKIEAQASPEIKAALRTGDLSINAAYNKVQQAARKEEIQRQVEEIEQRAIEKPDGLFDVIVIDPPWGYVREAHHGSFDANGRRCTNPYPEMTQAEISANVPRRYRPTPTEISAHNAALQKLHDCGVYGKIGVWQA